MQLWTSHRHGRGTVLATLLTCLVLLINPLTPLAAARPAQDEPGVVAPESLGGGRIFLPLILRSPESMPDPQPDPAPAPIAAPGPAPEPTPDPAPDDRQPPAIAGLPAAANLAGRPWRPASLSTALGLETASTAELVLASGWNLVALPLIPQDDAIAAVLAPIAGKYDLVFAYDGCDAADPWKSYDPSIPPEINDLLSLRPEIGFWIHTAGGASLPVQGQQVLTIQQVLCPGWNLAGYPSRTAADLPAALASLAGSYDLVFAYSAADAGDPWKSFDPAIPGVVNDLRQLGPGRGYWIHATGPTGLAVHNRFPAPQIAIEAPTPGQVLGTTTAQVTGVATSELGVAGVTVNGAPATLDGDQFTAQVTLAAGSQVINVVATDTLDQQGAASVAVAVDQEGPQITIAAPANRQSVYTTRPTVTLTYADALAAVDTASLRVVLMTASGGQSDITAALSIGPAGATGAVPAALNEGATYTLTVTLADTFGNVSTAMAGFYVPPAPETIVPPVQPGDAGWVSGVIYDSTTCDAYLTTCQGLAGARVTLEQVNETALAAVRAARQAKIAARLAQAAAAAAAGAGSATYRLPSIKGLAAVTTPVEGTVVTGPDGFFAFPTGLTGHYWLRVEKDGYTYGQREAEIVKERSAATNAIYLTPIDPAVTPCDATGCSHASADSQMQVVIPAGAIPTGEQVQVTATEFDQVEFLPSGALPEGTWETYAFNLGGDSDYEFQQPITVRLRNSRGFAPGSQIPLGYWNQHTMEWEHEGFGVVDPTGEWVEMQLVHFSNHDPNYPVSPSKADAKGDDESEADKECGAKDEPDKKFMPNIVSSPQIPCATKEINGSRIYIKSGRLTQDAALPPVTVQDREMAPSLVYNSTRAAAAEVIDVKLTVNPDTGSQLGDHIGWELYIQGQKTDSFTFAANLQQNVTFAARVQQSNEVGRYRYLWDGRDAQGRQLPPGIYDYAVKLSVPYRAQYCGTDRFGGPPDCVNRPTGRFVDATEDVWVRGTVELDAPAGNALGNGWALQGQQRLYEDEAGRILVTDGEREHEFYFPQKDLLSGGSTLTQQAAAQMPLPRPPAAPSVPRIPTSDQTGVKPAEPPQAPRPPVEPPQPITTTVDQPGPIEPFRPITETVNPPFPGEMPGPITSTHEFPAAASEQGSPELPARPEPAAPPPPDPALLPQPPALETLPLYTEILTPQGAQVCGEITSDTTWTAATGVYTVTCDVSVVAGVTLTIEPGVAVKFEHTSDDLIVAGALQAAGAEAAPIRFQPVTGGTRGSWGRVAFLTGSTGVVEHTVLEYGGASSGLLYIASDQVQVLDSVVQYSADTGIVIQAASPLISATQILSNTGDLGGGLYNDSGNPTLRDNVFRGNSASGSYSYGGGIYNSTGSPIIRNNIFGENSTSGAGTAGGGIYNLSGSPTIWDNTFNANSAHSGGGINNYSGGPTIQNNTFSGNGNGYYGGGIYNDSGSPTIRSNVFSGNASRYCGGGIYNRSDSPTIQNNTFFGNSSGLGGGICNVSGSPTVQDNTFSANSASGGGIYNSTGSPTIQNNTFNANSASSGGGIRNDSGSPTIQNNTFSGNSASYGGGGIYNDSGSPTIRSNIIAGNTGSGIYIASAHPALSVDYNNLWDNSGDYVGVSPGPHDIAADPRFVDAAAGDFHLLPDSPCIDAGDPYDYPLTDFEGDPRPMGAAPDIGADEFRGFGVSKRGPLAVAPGETITYTLALVNLAPSAASSAVLTDTLPPELRYLGHQADGLDCAHDGTPWGGQLTCTPTGGALAVGESRPLTLTVMATETLPAPRTVVNTVSACASVDGALAQAQARARTDVTWCRVRLNDGPVGNDVQAAINASADPADVIKVSGACTGTLTLDKTLTLQGGWRDDFGLRDHRAYTTTLDARWRSRVLTINGTVAPTIDGFAIIRGRSAIGGGIYIGSSSPIIQDNTFAGNLTTGQDNSGRGGGISNYSGSPTIQRNIFNTNSASTYGGGIFNNSGSPIIQNNNFSSNSASYGGGGISNFYGSPTIQNNTFNGNSASSGGGIDNGSGNPTIQNNTFNGNSASSGGGIDNGSGNPTIQNNTLYANLATGYSNRGGGIYNSGSPTIRSNIIAGNTGSGIYSSGVVPGPSVDYNNLWNNSGGDYVGVSPGPHDIAADPRFVDAAVGDFHLRSDSPCIDAGDPYHRPETDFEGDPRPMGMEVDIGADEMRGLGVTKTGPNATTPGETIAYRLAVVNLAPSAVSSVVLTDTLPLAMHYVNHQAAGLDCAHDGSPWGGYLTCTLTHSSLAVGESRPLTVTVEVNNVLPTPLSAINTVRVKAILSGEHTHTQARVKTDVTWCRVRLNDGPVGNDVQAAINASADPADVIKVSGACAGTLTLDKTLTLQGGWRDDFGLRDHRAYTTTLDARWRSRVLRINGAVAPTIDGFTILHGYLAGSGSGIYSDSGNPTIQNNTFSGNSATGYYGYGGGIYNGSGSPTIQNNTFADNSASSYGGGIYNYSGNPIIQNNAFAGNSASSYGGGIYNYSGNPIIQNNAFAGNSASSYGGGIYNYSGTPIIQNNNFSSNSAFQGGGIYNGAGNPIIQNNNLSSNSASYDGGGIYNYSGNPTIRNNAIAGNSAAAGGGIYIAWAGPSLSVDYNNLWDNSGGNYP